MMQKVSITIGAVAGTLGLLGIFLSFYLPVKSVPSNYYPDLSSYLVGEIVAVDPSKKMFRLKVDSRELLFPGKLASISSDSDFFYHNIYVDDKTKFAQSTVFIMNNKPIRTFGRNVLDNDFGRSRLKPGEFVRVLGQHEKLADFRYVAKGITFSEIAFINQ